LTSRSGLRRAGGWTVVVVLVCWVCCVVTMMTTLCVSVQRLREFNVYLCKKSLRKPKLIILFMDVYKVGSTGRVALGFVILAGLYPFWRVCLVSFWRETYIRRNSYMMDNFGRQKFNSDGQFCASHTQTHRQTDTLIFFITIEVAPPMLNPLKYKW
jgi:hypothetical protein